MPPERIAKYSAEGDISIDFHHTSTTEEELKTSEEKVAESQEKADELEIDDNLLFEPKLGNLFREAKRSGKGQLEVCLESTPTNAQLHSLHALPALSRSLAKNHPQILQEIYDERANNPNSPGNKFLNTILERTGKVESTVLADVVVECNERFWVKDVESGAIVQGHADGKVRSVMHTLRLERVSTFTPGKGRNLGDWLVTDVDDLLGGNRWFSPPVRMWWQAD